MAVSATDLEDLYENAPFAYFLMQRDGVIVSANATLVEWIGQQRRQLVGRRLRDFLTSGTRIFYETSVAPLISTLGEFEGASLDIVTINGEVIPVFAVASSRRSDNGNNELIRVALFKVTERRKYERQLLSGQQASQQAEQATRRLLESERETSVLREQFIAVLGHDLRNPLASISGGLRLLRKEQPEDRRELLLELLQASVLRMSTLIDNVLDFARGRLGAGIPLELRDGIWLAPVLEHVAAELRIGSTDRAIKTDFDLPEPIKCDPSRISQLVSNLLGNAITHGAPGEAVCLHADSKDKLLTIWVANKGIPIPATAMEHLFKPFFRGEVEVKKNGLGLGLHIASEIAKAHGGSLSVASTRKETRFTFTMPTNVA